MKKDNFGNRMKEYENISRIYLPKRMPVVIRIDGRAFHTLLKGFNKPFDDILIKTMQETTKYLCENIMGCKLAYTQSDEISLLLINYDTIDTDAWFKNNLQKIVSVSASMATMVFNKILEQNIKEEYWAKNYPEMSSTPVVCNKFIKSYKIYQAYSSALQKGAMFDARAFVLPKDEVCNYFIWRQKDATRNSIQLVAQANFTYKELHKKSSNELQDMLFKEKNINWNNYEPMYKRGTCVIRDNSEIRGKWIIDKNIPVFTQDRNYIEKFVFIEE